MASEESQSLLDLTNKRRKRTKEEGVRGGGTCCRVTGEDGGLVLGLGVWRPLLLWK
jgi:hypothetical protein